MAILVVGGALGCSSGGGGTVSTCDLGDMCVQVPAERVSATCTSVQYAYYSTNRQGTATASDMCSYFGGQGSFSINRDCFQLQRDALASYLGRHSAVQSGDITEEVAGIGDIAFYRYSTQTSTKILVILNGNHVITLYDSEFVDSASHKPCMTELAGDAVAAL